MAIPANYQGTGSQISDLLTPEVLGAYIDLKVMDAIKLTPFMDVDRTLEGRSGDTVTLPVYSYIGAAEDYAGRPVQPDLCRPDQGSEHRHQG